MSEKIDSEPVILVCDDDPNARAIAEGAIRSLGYQVLLAEDGMQAIKLCEASMPDAIVMDLMMPEMSGTEFVKWLRAQTREGYVPLLLVTARTDLEHKIEGLGSGADDYLTKPYHYRELQARVEALLRIRDLTKMLLERHAASEAALGAHEKELNPAWRTVGTSVQRAITLLGELDAAAAQVSAKFSVQSSNEPAGMRLGKLIEMVKAELLQAATALRAVQEP